MILITSGGHRVWLDRGSTGNSRNSTNLTNDLDFKSIIRWEIEMKNIKEVIS